MGTLFFAILQMVGDSVFHRFGSLLVGRVQLFALCDRGESILLRKAWRVWQTKIWSQYNY